MLHKALLLVGLTLLHSSAAQYPSGRQSQCPNVPRRPAHECTGQQSTCWSPGVRDLDCPSSGLCCFNGCVNICEGPPRQLPLAPVVPVVPVVPVKPVNPCNPSPCGPGTICDPSPFGNPICRCQEGLIPKPDTITGCGPECLTDGDCRHGYVCQNKRCIEKPDPCNPSPCGPGATCMVNSQGNPICRCEPGLVPKPDTITGCGPECVRDSDCKTGYICQNQKCIEKPDPCNPSPCGPGAICMVNNQGNPICRCEPGLVPKPDTITGCGPECIRDSDCKTGYICQTQKCIEKPDPCNPSPCGPGAICMVNNQGNPICRCEPGLVPKPDTITGCGPECVRDSDCKSGYICQDQRCIERPDPCDPSPCGPGTICMVNSLGNPICRCQEGLIPNPDTITGCKPECIVDQDCQTGYICTNQRCVEKPDPCNPSPCGPGTMCMENQFGNAVCRCLEGLVPKPDTITGCFPECEVDPDCQTGYVCKNQKCVEAPDPCVPNPCGPNAICTRQGISGYTCSCPQGFLGNPQVSCVQGECLIDEECPSDKACEDYHCINPCKPETCKKTDFCRVIQHIPTCGFNFMEVEQQPREVFVIGEAYKPATEISARTQPTVGQAYPHKPEQKSRNVVVIGSRHDDPSGGSAHGHSRTTIGGRYRRRKRQAARRIISYFHF